MKYNIYNFKRKTSHSATSSKTEKRPVKFRQQQVYNETCSELCNFLYELALKFFAKFDCKSYMKKFISDRLLRDTEYYLKS